MSGGDTVVLFINKNLNASRHSEHPPVRGKNVKRFIRWDHRLQMQNLFMVFKRVGSPNNDDINTVVTLGQQYNTGEKPTVMLYT